MGLLWVCASRLWCVTSIVLLCDALVTLLWDLASKSPVPYHAVCVAQRAMNQGDRCPLNLARQYVSRCLVILTPMPMKVTANKYRRMGPPSGAEWFCISGF